MINEIKRYELLYSTLATPYNFMALAAKDGISTIAEKAILENSINLTASNKFALNLKNLRNFVGT